MRTQFKYITSFRFDDFKYITWNGRIIRCKDELAIENLAKLRNTKTVIIHGRLFCEKVNLLLNGKVFFRHD